MRVNNKLKEIQKEISELNDKILKIKNNEIKTDLGIERFCTNQKALDMIMYSDFEIFETEKEAQKRLNELRVMK